MIQELLSWLRARCEALPEVTERADALSHAFEVRRRIVAYAAEVDGTTIVVLNADPDEIAALTAGGHPWFRPGSGRNRLGAVIDGGTDWDELGELLLDSYRRAAPKKLSALLDG